MVSSLHVWDCVVLSSFAPASERLWKTTSKQRKILVTVLRGKPKTQKPGTGCANTNLKEEKEKRQVEREERAQRQFDLFMERDERQERETVRRNRLQAVDSLYHDSMVRSDDRLATTSTQLAVATIQVTDTIFFWPYEASTIRPTSTSTMCVLLFPPLSHVSPSSHGDVTDTLYAAYPSRRPAGRGRLRLE